MSTLPSPFYEHLIGTAATDFATLIQIGQRIEDGIQTRKVFDHNKVQFPIKHSPSTKHERKLTPSAKGKNDSTIEFREKLERRQKKEMQDQVFTHLSETISDLFPKLLAANLIAKMP